MELKDKSYMMVKPCGGRYIEEVEQHIDRSPVIVDSRYFVDDWETVANELYAEEIKKHSPRFYEDFQAHIWVNKYFFGNEALVYVLKNPETTYKVLLDDTFRLKQAIRGSLNATKDGTCMFVLDVNRIDIPGKIAQDNGNLTLTQDGKSTEFDDMLAQLGRWKSYFLNYVHCPDAKVEDFQRELEILRQFGIFEEENKVDEKGFTLCKRMHSCRRPYPKR